MSDSAQEKPDPERYWRDMYTDLLKRVDAGEFTDHIGGPMTPRMLTKAEAAAYCGCSLRAFTGWVDRGIVPGALPGTIRWDRNALDAALDRASGLQPITPSDELTPYQRWKAEHAPIS